MKKYEITDITHPDNPKLHRIRALIGLTENIHAGDLGGFVETELRFCRNQIISLREPKPTALTCSVKQPRLSIAISIRDYPLTGIGSIPAYSFSPAVPMGRTTALNTFCAPKASLIFET